MFIPSITIALPDWISSFLATKPNIFPTAKDRMELVVELAKLNVQNKTGGPFAAAVFSLTVGKLIAPGVNLVVSTSCSSAHAEMIALTLAQKALGTFDLGISPNQQYELVTSTAPCAMCLGAIPWSGVKKLTCAARDEDARSIGFDEGSKRTDWVEELQKRGITVVNDFLREESVAVLKSYSKSEGLIYNGRQNKL